MPFPGPERAALPGLRRIGPTMLARLRQKGMQKPDVLRKAGPSEVLTAGAALTSASCWRNGHQARAAVDTAIGFARTPR